MAQKATASRSKLARVLGVAGSTLRSYAIEEGFPEATLTGKEQEYEILDVVLWWLREKARKPQQQELRDALNVALGEGDEAPEWTVKDEREQLDLRLKEAEVERRLGELVRVSEIQALLRGFAARLSDAFESVESTTGQPVIGIVEPVFDAFFADLRSMQRRRI